MIVIDIPFDVSQAKILIDGQDMTSALGVVKIEVLPIEPGKEVQVTMTIHPDLVKISALPELVRLKLTS